MSFLGNNKVGFPLLTEMNASYPCIFGRRSTNAQWMRSMSRMPISRLITAVAHLA